MGDRIRAEVWHGLTYILKGGGDMDWSGKSGKNESTWMWWLDSGYILKTLTIGFADRFDKERN